MPPIDAPVALVTGAGSGIGRQTALTLLEDGFRVVLAGRREARLRASLEDLAPAARERALAVTADVTDPVQVDALFARVVEAHGRLDVLFNNAGVFGPSAPVPDVALEDWQAVVATNLTGAFLCAQAAFRIMRDQRPEGGRIINNGSISAQVPRPHTVAYTATKHGVAGLTKALALEGRAHRIACGQIDVGNAATEMTASFAEGVLQANGTVASEPAMDAHDVAEAVRFMARLPLDATVPFMTIMATGMPFIGRG